MKTPSPDLRSYLFDQDDPKLWNDLIKQLPFFHILQSHQWGQFKSRHGWTTYPLVFREDDLIKGAALVLRRKLSGLPWGIMYVPKGPVLDYSDSPLLDAILGQLEHFARQEKALLIKIDPDVSFEDAVGTWNAVQRRVVAPVPSIPRSSLVIDALVRRGWHLSSEQIQFKNTLLIDLGQNEEELLAQMKSKARYNIRLAVRKGVRIRFGGLEDLQSFYRLYSETSARDDFIIRPFEYYHDAWKTFLQNDLADLLLAEWEGDLIAGLLLFRLGHKAWYMYGASSSDNRNLMPNHLLQWEAINLSKRKGCLLYDLWGAPDDFSNENDPMVGVYRFKSGLGGQLSRHVGAYDFATGRVLPALYTWLLPRYVSLLRSRHRPYVNGR